jgi:hypothetical protein
MKSAFVRLLLISLGAFLLISIALFWLRFLGKMQAFAPLEHPLLKQGSWWVLRVPDSHPSENSLAEWLKTQIEPRNRIPWLDLRRTKDGHWIVAPEEWVQHPQGKRAVQALDFKEVQALWPQGHPLELSELFTYTGDHALWLNFIEKDPFWVNEAVAAVPKRMEKKILAVSPVKQFAKKLREAQPEWLYASDPTTLSQFRMLEGVFLETIATFWPDVFFAPMEREKQYIFTPRMITELNRRQLPVVIDFRGQKDSVSAILSSLKELRIKGVVADSADVLEQARSQLDESE